LSKKQFSHRRNSLVRIEVDKILYSASESVASQILSAAMPANGNKGSLELWEIENRLTPIFNSAINLISEINPNVGDVLSFELKRRSRTLTDDLISLLLESLRDAFRDGVDVDYPTPRTIHLAFRNSVDNVAFIRKEYSAKVYEVLRHLVG